MAWVGVRCDPDVAARREAQRPDRDTGMAAQQAHQVHEGVHYDVQVDTSRTSPGECARTVLRRLRLAEQPLPHQTPRRRDV